MDDRRRRRWPALLPALLLGGVAALTVTWVVGGQGSGVSLLAGPFPLVLKLAALVCWITAVVRSGGRWWRLTVPLRVGATVAVVGSIAFALHWSGTVDDHYPPSFAVWVGAAILALLVCPAAVRGSRGWRRATAVAAVPLSAVAAFLLINDHYGYWPALGDLVGHPLAGAMTSTELAAALKVSPGAITSDASGQGRLAPLDIPAATSHFSHMAGSVYLPPAFFRGHRQLPVVVMLAGVPNTPAAWPHAGFATATADSLAAAHGGVAPILVFVDGNGSITADSECVDGPRGRAETYLAVDVPRYVIHTFGASADPADWAVLGFSEGGTCALDLALRHPDVFGRFVDLAGDPAPTLGDPDRTLSGLYGGDRAAMAAHDPATLLETKRYPHTIGWFAVGTDDASHLRPGEDVSPAAAAAGIEVHRLTIDGAHNWQFASRAFRQILPPLVQDLGIGGRAATIAEPKGDGYWLVTRTGAVLPFGDARSFGSPEGKLGGRSVVGMAATPSGAGYWVVASDGSLFPFGDAPDLGSPRDAVGVVAVVSTSTGRGAWIVTGDGTVYPRGDARDFGSLTGRTLNQPIVGMAANVTGAGYWLLGADGGVFAFGDAAFAGSLAGSALPSPAVGIAATPTGQGYWIVTADGALHPFMSRSGTVGGNRSPGAGVRSGNAGGGAAGGGFTARPPGQRTGPGGFGGLFGGGPGAHPAMNQPVVGIGALSTDMGWWLAGADGGVFSFGDARFFGSAAGQPLADPVVAIAPMLEE